MRYTCYEVAYGGAGAGGMAMEDATEESGYDTEDDSLGDTEQEQGQEDSIACQISYYHRVQSISSCCIWTVIEYRYSPVLPLRIRPTGRTRMSRIHWATIQTAEKQKEERKKKTRIQI